MAHAYILAQNKCWVRIYSQNVVIIFDTIKVKVCENYISFIKTCIGTVKGAFMGNGFYIKS